MNGHDCAHGHVDWDVVSVFDPDGRGADFSYTVGLSHHAVPELHLWGRPTDGEDPGADWLLSPTDRALLLNMFADQLLAGEIDVGSQHCEEFDAGLAQVRFRLGALVTPDQLDAYQLPIGTAVIPIRWELTRTPEGPLDPLDETAARQVRTWVERIRKETYELAVQRLFARLENSDRPRPDDKLPPTPSAWQCEPRFAPITLDPGQPFGPAHALVVARGSQVLTADAEMLRAFLSRVIRAIEGGRTPSRLNSLLAAHARQAGRSEAIQRVRKAAGEVVTALIGGPEPTERWLRAVTMIAEESGEQLEQEVLDGCAYWVDNVVRSLLVTEALADVLPTPLLAWGRGPWAWTMSGDRCPGPEWVASRRDRELVHQALTRQTPEALAKAGQQLVSAHADPGFCDEVGMLSGWGTTGQASLPARLRRPFIPDSCGRLPMIDQFRVHELGLYLLALVAFADRFDECTWLTMTQPIRPFLIGLWERPPVRRVARRSLR